jgi:hypothetical protein
VTNRQSALPAELHPENVSGGAHKPGAIVVRDVDAVACHFITCPAQQRRQSISAEERHTMLTKEKVRKNHSID